MLYTHHQLTKPKYNKQTHDKLGKAQVVLLRM